MKLYYHPGACSLADHVALLEAGLPFESEEVDLGTKRTASGKDYTAINTKGYVPALALDDGAILTENVAILSYIADRAGTLMPDGMARWRTLEALAYITTELHKNFGPFFMPDASAEAKQKAADTLAKRYALLEEQVGDDGFLIGDALSVADCYLFVTLLWAEQNDLATPPRLAAYRDRLKQRPAFAKALAEEGLS